MSLPALSCASRTGASAKMPVDAAAEHVGHGLGGAAIGDDLEFHLGGGLEQLERKMRIGADPGDRHADPAGLLPARG